MSKEQVSTEQKEFKTTKSSGFIRVLAVLMLIAGLFLVVTFFIPSRLDSSAKSIFLVYGVSCITVSALLFIISNLADDVHLLTYLVEHYIESDIDSKGYILSHLRTIEEKINKQ